MTTPPPHIPSPPSDTFSHFPYLGCDQYVERIGVGNTVFSVFIKTNNILMYNIRTAGMALSSPLKIRKQMNHKIAKPVKYGCTNKKISFLSNIQND